MERQRLQRGAAISPGVAPSPHLARGRELSIVDRAHALGNRSLGLILQAKLALGRSDDPRELEADRIANACIEHFPPTDASLVRRAQPSPAQEASPAPVISRAPLMHTGTQLAVPSAVVNRLRAPGPGEQLSGPLRATLSKQLGAELDEVRIHRDAEADSMNRAVQASAFTTGRHIYFGAGQYAPETRAGRHLLTHEVVHTIQQGHAQRSDRPVSVLRQAAVSTRASPSEDEISRLLGARTFRDVWNEFERCRVENRDSDAIALVHEVLARMSSEDALEHAGELSLWLLRHGEHELALDAISALENAWWMRYIARAGPGVPLLTSSAFGITPPAELVTQAESEANAGRHDVARRLFEAAYLFLQMQLARLAAEEARREELPREVARALAPLLSSMELVRRSEILAVQQRILNFYPRLAADAQRRGNAALASNLAGLGQTLATDLRDHYSLEAPQVVGAEPTAPGAPPGDTARPSTGSGSAGRSAGPSRTLTTSSPVAAPPSSAPAAAPAEPDQVIDAAPPFDGALIMTLIGLRYIFVRSHRYAISTNIARIAQWGNNLFGVKGFAILADVDTHGTKHYYAASLDEAHTSSDLRAAPVEGHQGLASIAGARLLDRTASGHLIVAAHFKDLTVAHDIFGFARQLQGAAAGGQGALPAALTRATVFREIDALLEGGSDEQRERAADLLSELTVTAFAAVSWEAKARYLDVLVRAWTLAPQERAIVEIIKSVTTRAQLEAIFQRLREGGIWNQLFDDLDGELWSLLITLGEQFGSPGGLTLEDLRRLLLESRLLEPVAGIAIGPDGPEISVHAMDELAQAARAFVNTIGGFLESIYGLIAHPDQLIEGVGQLLKLMVMWQLADIGYVPAIEYRAQLVGHIAQQVVFGMKGAAILGNQVQRILTRVKWAVIWEVVSMVVGVGEIRAAAEALNLSEKVAAIARFVRLLGLIGRAAEEERVATSLTRLATILGRATTEIHGEERLLVLLSHLPEEHAGQLAHALEGIELSEGMTLAQLTAAHPELARVATRSLRQAECLSVLAGKAGGVSDEVVRVFQRIVGAGHEPEEILRIMRRIPDGEGARFSRMVGAIPADVSLAGVASRDLLNTLAGSTTRMNAVIDLGFAPVQRVFQRAGQNAALVDDYLTALSAIRGRLPPATAATDFAHLLESLEQGEPGALFRIEQEIRGGSGAGRLASTLRQATEQWASGFERIPAKGSAGTAWHDFQVTVCGPQETRIVVNGVSVEADGIVAEQGLLRDAKYTERLDRSPFIDVTPHPIPDFIREGILERIEDELARYAAIIRDPTTPVVGLEIVTNTPLTVPFWERMLRQQGIPGRVTVRPWP